eukprot:CAMPEP_0115133452 /NCGR_PEP_ID=MMETSP0227-20121206/54443_1 /TAXON_ID=89957 /ORGANISM="Polarella glacialis, Strain CCMP 1383" /LENGTH=104 /DNA_ID=CAMNT_0002539611 /DNA_START=139 /DNA_END=453 /DNA_ORIENTATION=-
MPSFTKSQDRYEEAHPWPNAVSAGVESTRMAGLLLSVRNGVHEERDSEAPQPRRGPARTLPKVLQPALEILWTTWGPTTRSSGRGISRQALGPWSHGGILMTTA